MPTDPGYMARWEEKLAYYNDHGIRESENLIITSDGDNGGLDSKGIDDLVKEIFDLWRCCYGNIIQTFCRFRQENGIQSGWQDAHGRA